MTARAPLGEQTGRRDEEHGLDDRASISRDKRATATTGSLGTRTEGDVGPGDECPTVSTNGTLSGDFSVDMNTEMSAMGDVSSRVLRTLQTLRHLHGLLRELKRRSTTAK